MEKEKTDGRGSGLYSGVNTLISVHAFIDGIFAYFEKQFFLIVLILLFPNKCQLGIVITIHNSPKNKNDRE